MSLTRGLWSNLTKPLIERRQLASDVIFCFLPVAGAAAIYVPQCIISDHPYCLLDFQIENINGKLINVRIVFETCIWNFPGLTGTNLLLHVHIELRQALQTLPGVSYQLVVFIRISFPFNTYLNRAGKVVA